MPSQLKSRRPRSGRRGRLFGRPRLLIVPVASTLILITSARYFKPSVLPKKSAETMANFQYMPVVGVEKLN